MFRAPVPLGVERFAMLAAGEWGHSMPSDWRNFFGVLCLCVGGSAAAHDIDRTPAPDLAVLKTRIADVLTAHHVPGAGYALLTRDELLTADGVGLADLAHDMPVTADTRFRVGSLSKPVLAVALLQLAEQNRLDLQASVKDIAPEVDIRNPWQETDLVRVAQLLEHSAGFDDMHFRNVYNLEDDPRMPLLGALNRGYHALQVRWRPGVRFAYSTPGYGVAGYLLEKTVGQPFENWLAEQVLQPLGMTRSTFDYSGGELDGLAVGYDTAQEAVRNRPIYLRPAGNLATTAGDLAHFVHMLMHGGRLDGNRVLQEDSVLRMQHGETTLAAKAGVQTGYGMGLQARVQNSLLLYGHSGSSDGYTSSFGYSTRHGFGFVVLLNRANAQVAVREIRQLILAYLGQHAVPDFPPVADVAPAILTTYTGYYRQVNPRNEIMHFLDYLLNVVTVSQQDGRLYIEPLLGPVTELVPVSETLFRRETEPVASVALVDVPDRGRALVMNDAFYRPVSAFMAVTPFWLVMGALLLLLFSLLHGLVWLIWLLLGRLPALRYWRLRLAALAVPACLLGSGLVLLGADLVGLATFNWRTAGFFLLTLGFLVTTVWSVVEAVRGFRGAAPWNLRGGIVLTALAGSVLNLYLLYWGVIGLRLWAW